MRVCGSPLHRGGEEGRTRLSPSGAQACVTFGVYPRTALSTLLSTCVLTRHGGLHLGDCCLCLLPYSHIGGRAGREALHDTYSWISHVFPPRQMYPVQVLTVSIFIYKNWTIRLSIECSKKWNFRLINRARARVLGGPLYLIMATSEYNVDYARTTVLSGPILGALYTMRLCLEPCEKALKPDHWSYHTSRLLDTQSCSLPVRALGFIILGVHRTTLSRGKLGVLKPNPRAEVT